VEIVIMAFGTTAAGTITKEQTLLSIRRLPVAASTTLTKGNICEQDAGGDLIVSPTARTAEVNHYVALETIDNSSGADGALHVPVAVAGHFVTVVADGAIRPGTAVVISGSTAGQAIAYVASSHAKNQVVGIYWGKEGGIIAKGSSTPYLESFTDSADFSPADAADGDVIEVQLVD
jgi:hypothetical protein